MTLTQHLFTTRGADEPTIGQPDPDYLRGCEDYLAGRTYWPPERDGRRIAQYHGGWHMERLDHAAACGRRLV